MFLLIENPLSFNTITKFLVHAHAFSIPSKAKPPVKAPSPITAMTRASFFKSSFAASKPTAAEIEVDACPAPKLSYSLSEIFGKPEIPPSCLIVEKCSARPVKSLWA